VFRRLSVFAGGWSLEAAEAVCAGAGVDELEVLDLLTRLFAKSLVQVEQQGGEARFRLLETLRQYAQDRLVDAEEVAAVRDRHRDWFLHLAERAKPELIGPKQVVWLDRLEREHDNLRAALGWVMKQGPAELGLRLGGALWQLWHVRDYQTEGREWLALILAAPGALAPTVARAEVLAGACELCELGVHQGEGAAARRLAEESLAIYEALDDQRGIALALCHLAMVANQEGDQARTEELGAEALTRARRTREQWAAAKALETLGLAAIESHDWPLARRRLGEGVAIFRTLGDHRSIAGVLELLGWLESLQGENSAALACFDEALTIARALRSEGRIGGLLRFLGMLAYVEGDYEHSRVLLEESHGRARQAGDRGQSALALLTLGLLARAEGDCERAEALAREGLVVGRDAGAHMLLMGLISFVGILAIERGASRQGARLLARGDAGTGSWWLLPDQRRAYEESIVTARAALGEQCFETAWAAGQAMTLEDGVQLALAERDREPVD
jgi:tetratricopeptide (TPR) repeat protein